MLCSCGKSWNEYGVCDNPIHKGENKMVIVKVFSSFTFLTSHFNLDSEFFKHTKDYNVNFHNKTISYTKDSIPVKEYYITKSEISKVEGIHIDKFYFNTFPSKEELSFAENRVQLKNGEVYLYDKPAREVLRY